MVGIFIGIFIIILILMILLDKKRTKHIENVLLSGSYFSADEFLKIRKEKVFKSKPKYYSTILSYRGVYILRNVDKECYYVGQSKDVFSRVFAHLSGRGNGDVYADFKYGDYFEVVTVPFKNSGFETLNELEKSFINYYEANKKGYNRTKGNR